MTKFRFLLVGALATFAINVYAQGETTSNCQALRDKSIAIEEELKATVGHWLAEVPTLFDAPTLENALKATRVAQTSMDTRDWDTFETKLAKLVEPPLVLLRAKLTDVQVNIVGKECSNIHVERWVLNIKRSQQPTIRIQSVGRDLGAFGPLALIGAVCNDTASPAFATSYLNISDLAAQKSPEIISRPAPPVLECQ